MTEAERIVIYFVLGIIMLTATLYGGAYLYHSLDVNNFQATIKDLSDEQKCIHICGFEFHNYLENYKFCLEKCDRISERLSEGGTK